MISVALASYNGEKYIYKQIKSILEQTVAVDEIIVCDDNSTDRTIEEIKRINDSRIKIYTNTENLGYIRNFYKAINLTSGEYIFLADQDDIWKLDKVSKMLDIMHNTNCMALCTNFEIIDSEGNKIEDKQQYQMNSFISGVKTKLTRIKLGKLVYGNIVQGCTYCFTDKVKKAFIQINNDEVVHDLQIMMIASAMGDVYFLNDELIKYRLHTNNSIGFSKKGRKLILKKKKPTKKPFMVKFIDDMSKVVKVKRKVYYKALYYLRIPYIKAVISRLVFGK